MFSCTAQGNPSGGPLYFQTALWPFKALYKMYWSVGYEGPPWSPSVLSAGHRQMGRDGSRMTLRKRAIPVNGYSKELLNLGAKWNDLLNPDYFKWYLFWINSRRIEAIFSILKLKLHTMENRSHQWTQELFWFIECNSAEITIRKHNINFKTKKLNSSFMENVSSISD